MTQKQLGYIAPISIAISEGATTPDPGIVGVQVWSSTLSKLMSWNGTKWIVQGAANAVGFNLVFGG